MTNDPKLAKSSGGDNANAKKLLPPKPYTEYTIFFRLERTYLLQSMGIIDEEVVSSLDPSHFDPVELPRPTRYERLALPPYWYSSLHKAAIEKRRKHRKRAGRMDLQTLSKTISANWRKADPAVVAYCRKLARAEMKKYKERMEVMNTKNENQVDKASDAEARAEAIGGVQEQRQQQALLLLQEKAPTVASAAPFVLAQAQAKQQVGNAQRPRNEVALNSNGVLSLQDFVFTKLKQAETVAPDVTSSGTLSLRDLVFSKPKQVTSATMPMSAPAAAAPVTVNNNIDRLRNSFNEVMGYSSRGLQINQEPETVLQLPRLQAVQHQEMNICGADSTSSVKPLAPFEYSSAQVIWSPPGDQPENLPEKKNKRKFVRRASAPPEFLAHGNVPARPRAGADGGGDADADTFPGEDHQRRTKRRSSMIDLEGPGEGGRLDARGLQELGAIRRARAMLRESRRARGAAARGLSDSFKKELDSGRFTHVPNWEKEDADELLDLLDVPQAGNLVAGNDCASAFTADQEMGTFMNGIGIGDDSYCKTI